MPTALILGYAGRDALAAAARSFRAFVLEHPGRYGATIGLEPAGPDDPPAGAGQRSLGPFRAVLRGYDIAEPDVDHALRMLRSLFHGFATLQASNSFQWSADIDESFEWLITFTDRGLRATAESKGASGRHWNPAERDVPAGGRPRGRPPVRTDQHGAGRPDLAARRRTRAGEAPPPAIPGPHLNAPGRAGETPDARCDTVRHGVMEVSACAAPRGLGPACSLPIRPRVRAPLRRARPL